MTDSLSQWNEQETAELRRVFYAQAHEITDELQDAMLRLEADPRDGEVLKTVKRHVHTLKGDARSIGFTVIGTLCHRMEDVITSLMDGGVQGGHEAVELLLSCVDAVNDLLEVSESGRDSGQAHEILERIGRFLDGFHGSGNLNISSGSIGPQRTEYQTLQIEDALKNGRRVYEAEIGFHSLCAEKGIAALMVTKRVGALGQIIQAVPDPEKEDVNGARSMSIILSTEADAESVAREACIAGMTSVIEVRDVCGKTRTGGASKEKNGGSGVSQTPPQTPAPTTAPASRSEMLRVEASRVDLLLDLVGELIIGRSMIEELTKEIESGAPPAEMAPRLLSVNASLERTLSDLQKGVMKMRMVPVHHVFRKFPKIVRDLSVEKGKQVRLELVGSGTELDKRIVDALGEPLAHIVRNLIDHGIESPEERRAAGKEPEGVITLKAYHEASRIVVEAGDDGRGIDCSKLKRKAVERGFLGAEEAGRMHDADAMGLVFLSGLSTAETVSETSGRGVGMDAVKTAVEGLKGAVEIETEHGKGTLFRLRLPLTLAVIKALLFEVSGRLYAVPVPVVAEVAKIVVDDLITVDGKETLLLRDQTLSIISLQDLFGVEESGSRKKFVLVLGLGARKAGLLIDRIMWQQELVIKALDSVHVQSPLVAGASILGNGKVVLILDVLAAIKKAVENEKRKLAAV